MPAHQLHLFGMPKRLEECLGKAFFTAVPRCPGVYVMTGSSGRVLYIGQSRNLRARLSTYKNARPDRVPRKIIRLVHEVDSITWERCPDPEAALLREGELLRLHRPKFNRAGVAPKAYHFLWVQYRDEALELGRAQSLPPKGEIFGAFKGGALAGYSALVRLLWSVLRQPHSLADFPAGLLQWRVPRLYHVPWNSTANSSALLRHVLDFLAGSSDTLIEFVRRLLPEAESADSLFSDLLINDLGVLREFYLSGPAKNAELIARYDLDGVVIPQERLDELLLLSRSRVQPQGAR